MKKNQTKKLDTHVVGNITYFENTIYLIGSIKEHNSRKKIKGK